MASRRVDSGNSMQLEWAPRHEDSSFATLPWLAALPWLMRLLSNWPHGLRGVATRPRNPHDKATAAMLRRSSPKPADGCMRSGSFVARFGAHDARSPVLIRQREPGRRRSSTSGLPSPQSVALTSPIALWRPALAASKSKARSERDERVPPAVGGSHPDFGPPTLPGSQTRAFRRTLSVGSTELQFVRGPGARFGDEV